MNMRKAAIMPALIAGLALGACTAEQTQEGQLPEYEQTQEGQLPGYDVDPARVEVGTDTQVVETPDIDIEPANRPRNP